MNLYYREKEVTPDLYCLEWFNMDGDNFRFFTGNYAYQSAVIWAHEHYITGKIIYCLSLQSQNVVDGMPIKRGLKTRKKRTDLLGKSFTPQEVKHPVHMKPIF